jgi:hypothetical protein
LLVLLQQKIQHGPELAKKSGKRFGFRVVAVDSGASTCNHAIHEFFVSTSCSHLVAPLIARGQ